MDIYICSNLNFNLNNPKILIISCDKIGFDIANKFFLNPISATTTKPKRKATFVSLKKYFRHSHDISMDFHHAKF